MKIRIILISFLIISALSTKAQPPEVIYEGNILKSGFYNTLASPFTDDGPYNIGFSFKFYGNTYTQFYFSPEGFISFTDQTANYSTESDIPFADPPNNYIAAFWDNLATDPSGKILYKTIGSAGNRKCIIQYKNMLLYSSPINFLGTFSIILYETSNKIQIQYRLIVDPVEPRAHGSSASIGIENSDGTAGLEYSDSENRHTVSKEQAISFTPTLPDCLIYSLNSDDIYDGVYLTTNITLPEPGITNLISPAQDGITNSDHTFTWSAAPNAASYTLRISQNSDMSSAVTYSAGSNLSYSVTGLTVPATYYWQVFATNATGTTWCEIRRFTTSSTPPIAGVPQTIWVEQSQDKTIQLNYSGGDGSTKTASVTSLPAQGQIFQYSSGVKGSQITSVPSTVTDPARNIIYTAPLATGNGIGNFKFKITDDTGESPEATVTVNVSPSGIPEVLYVAKSTGVEIQFDRIMSDPSGKHGQFGVKINGSSATMTSAALKTGDPYTIVLGFTPALTGTETVSVSYTQGDATSSTGGYLLSFTDLPVTLKAQTLTFGTALNKKYGDPAFTLSATSNGLSAMTYSSSNLGVATVSTNTLTIVSVGTSDITARQAGDATWAPAKYIKPLTVAKGDQTITFSSLPAKTYGDADFAPGATASSTLSVSYSSDNTAVATIVAGKIHIISGGTAVITASQAGNTLWNPATDVQRTLNVSKANQTITFSSLPSKTYGDADFDPGATTSSALSVSYSSGNTSVATIVSGKIHIVGTGSAVITASQSGNDNYNAATSVDQTLNINKADQTITFSALPSKTYGDADFDPGATASSALSVSYASDNTSVATIVAGQIHITGAGSAVITASQAGNTNYNAAPDVTRTLTVNKASAAITLSGLSVNYNGLSRTPTTTTSPSGLTVDLTFDGSSTPPVNAGSYSVAGTINNPNYSGTTTGTFIINKAPLTCSADNKSRLYGAPNPAFTLSYSGFVNSETSSVIDNVPSATTSAGATSNTGTYPISVSGGSDNNYTFNYTDGILTINKAILTVTADDKSRAYGEPNPALTISYSGFANSENSSVLDLEPSVSTTAVAGTAVGTVPVSVSGGNDNNYDFTYVNGTLTINKATATLVLDGLTHTYNGTAQSAGYTTTPAGLTADLTYDGSASAPVNAGTYTVTGTINDASYQGSATATMTISKLALIASADSKSKIYGDPLPVLTVSVSGFVSGESASDIDVLPVAVTTATSVSPAGSYSITPSGGSDNNYTFTYSDGTLTITKASATVTLSSLTASYNGLSQPPVATTVPVGLTVDFSYTGSANNPVNAGSYAVTATVNDINYTGSASGTYVIDKVLLTFTADDKSRPYLQDNPVLTWSVSGFVNGETSAVIDNLPAITTTAVRTSAAGSYPISFSGGNDNNYSFNFIAGTLTVSKISQTITWSSSPERLLRTESATLNATSSAGLPVEYESTDISIATVSGNQLTGVSDGTVQIRAFSNGDNNYNSAEAFVSTEIYSTHKDILNLFTPNNDGINDFWVLPDMESWGKCDVRVFSRSGKLVYSNPDYDNRWDGTWNGTPLPEGAYFYVIKTENAGTMKGTINIVR